MSLQAVSSIWEAPSVPDVLRAPLPFQNFGNRCLVRALTLLAQRRILAVHGLEHVTEAHDPFILALNHSTRTEAVLVPALLIFHRGGRLIHFLADWNFRLIPGIGLIYRRAETVTVTRKPAKPRLLNVLKPLYLDPLTAFERGRAHLLRGQSLGIFPEGAVNRSPTRLLPGRRGAARLSLETGVPVVPAGIRFPGLTAGAVIGDRALMDVTIGQPMHPPPSPPTAALADVRAWHAALMREISRLSGKSWEPWTWESQPCDAA